MQPIDNTPEGIIKYYNHLQKNVKGTELKLLDKNGIFRAITVGKKYKAIDFVLYNTSIDGICVIVPDDIGYNVEVSIKRFDMITNNQVAPAPNTDKTFFQKIKDFFTI